MLTIRQIKILNQLEKNGSEYTRAKDLVNICNVSQRTLYKEIESIKEEMNPSIAELECVQSRGYRLIINSKDAFSDYMDSAMINSQNTYNFNDQSIRVKFIIMKLLQSGRYVHASSLCNDLSISDSGLRADLKKAETILSGYDLKLVLKPRYGYFIQGSESSKRNCIIKENIIIIGHQNTPLYVTNRSHQQLLEQVSHIVSNVMTEEKYAITDVILSNIIVHVCTAIERMLSDHYVEPITLPFSGNISDKREHIIAEKIIQKCAARFNLETNPNEINLLALNLGSKKNFDNNDIIRTEVNDFISEVLGKIKAEFSTDFLNDMDLRIALSLHLMPLLLRLKYHMQLRNNMTYEIKQKYPFAFDIAAFFCNEIHSHFSYRCTDDEISYIAVYFNWALEGHYVSNAAKSVLIICPNRNSETLLLRQNFHHQFGESISKLDIVSSLEAYAGVAGHYDIVLSTDAGTCKSHPSIVYINYFLDDQDASRISALLKGQDIKRKMTDYFSPELTYIGNVKDEDDAIRIICRMADEKFHCRQKMKQEIVRRESMTCTYYGNFIAIPHPASPVTEDTHVFLLLTRKPISWGSPDNQVRLIISICIGKSDRQAMGIWFLASTLISNRELIQSVITQDHPSYFSIMEAFSRSESGEKRVTAVSQ